MLLYVLLTYVPLLFVIDVAFRLQGALAEIECFRPSLAYG